MFKTLTALATSLATVLALAACGAGDDTSPEPSTRTAANGQTFNDADVAFATDMIQHHAQALLMVDRTMGRELDPEVQGIAEAVRMAQSPEIETMAGWLTDWDQPIPATVRDHANAHGDGHVSSDPDMPGMMSEEQMDELEAASGTEFQELFLELMIEHHQGAIEMAEAEQADGAHSGAIALAEAIASSQQDEVDVMQSLLDS